MGKSIELVLDNTDPEYDPEGCESLYLFFAKVVYPGRRKGRQVHFKAPDTISAIEFIYSGHRHFSTVYSLMTGESKDRPVDVVEMMRSKEPCNGSGVSKWELAVLDSVVVDPDVPVEYQGISAERGTRSTWKPRIEEPQHVERTVEPEYPKDASYKEFRRYMGGWNEYNFRTPKPEYFKGILTDTDEPLVPVEDKRQYVRKGKRKYAVPHKVRIEWQPPDERFPSGVYVAFTYVEDGTSRLYDKWYVSHPDKPLSFFLLGLD